MKRTVILGVLGACACLLLGTSGAISGPEKVEISKATGGSVKTELSPDIILNSDSTLQREWVTIRHESIPAKIQGTAGVTTVYEDGRGYSGNYKYKAEFWIGVTEPVTAIEVRFVTFDVWGDVVGTLVMSEVKDLAIGVHQLDGKWSLYSENDASEFYASIGYVARVRTKAGKVLVADTTPIVGEARRICAKFMDADLEPKSPIAPTK